MPSSPWTLKDRLWALWARDQDPFLDELRWRLHLRLLLISAALTAAMLVRGYLQSGSLDLLIGLAATLAAWAFLRKAPAYNRLIIRGVLLLFVSLGTHHVWVRGQGVFPPDLLALMIMPVFALLLDGVTTGLLVLAAPILATALWLFRFAQLNSGQTLAVAFTGLSALGLFFSCLAHTWIFGRLVEERRQAAQAIGATRGAVAQLANTLSQQVFAQTRRLQRDLQEQGLSGLDAALALHGILKDARLARPAELPVDTVQPDALLEGLRRDAMHNYLGVGLVMAGVALVSMLILQVPLWQIALAMTVVAALLYWGSQGDPRWRWRLRAFLGMGLLCTLGDVWLSRTSPPAASLVFLPPIVFFACMLDDFWPALLVCALALGLVLAAALTQGPGFGPLHATLAFVLPALVAVSAATLPMYRSLLQGLSDEGGQLGEGLKAYRRLISTFFHDLANPLAVLGALAQLPAALRTDEDVLRARRMAARMDGVAQAARQAMLGSAPMTGQANLTQLADELYDVFKERLQEKELRWVLNVGPDLPLAQSGPMLRDSILGNLLSNAVKFSPPGGRIELSGFETGGSAHLILSDTGRGIPSDVLEDLAHGRVPKSRPGTEGETGTGYGLLLAQTYMNELGGRLVLRPRREGGTEAELILPLHP